MDPRLPSHLKLVVLLLTVCFCLARDVALAEGACVSAPCHATLIQAKTVHPVAESCESCHESVATPHPQKDTKTFKLTQAPRELCLSCHDALGKKSLLHPPFRDGKCTVCHNPHASSEAHLLAQPQKDLCLSCHKTVITRTMTTLHGPVGEGQCTACHDPHESQHTNLLVRDFPAGPYAPYTDTAFDLCFGCHDRALVQNPETSTATHFRDGKRNLHYLHVNNKQKGRSCTLCHSIHGGASPVLVADSAPFGKWNLPIKFAKTATGGGCSPGCHRPKNYDRTSRPPKTEAAKPVGNPR